MMRIARLIRIHLVALRFGLDEFLLGHERVRGLRPFVNRVLFWRDLSQPRGVRLREALQALGPIFVKFGQMLSTRRDLLPPDISDELAKLQDRVPPFPAEQVLATLARAYGKPVDQVFKSFDLTPVASASVAQVHFADLPDGTPVAVKVLRPDIHRVIEHDLALMQTAAGLVEKLWSDGKRLRPLAVVGEFEKTIRDELDLTREAANCSQLRRNFKHSPLLLVPEIEWDWTTDRSAGDGAHGRHSDRPHRGIAARGHRPARGCRAPAWKSSSRRCSATATSTPTCIRATSSSPPTRPNHGKYIALDFGIMGTLSETDKSYLAQNFLAFFRRDYHRVATAHIESGWVPPDTRVDELEAEIRVVCEPIFDRPLREISLGKVLVSLFRASRRFNVQIQPQLTLLQKTLLNVEGLGRQLDPELDLWVTAKPFLERWMQDQIGLPALQRRLLRRGALHRCRAARIAAPPAPAPAGAAGCFRIRRRRTRGRAEDAQPLARRDRRVARRRDHPAGRGSESEPDRRTREARHFAWPEARAAPPAVRRRAA